MAASRFALSTSRRLSHGRDVRPGMGGREKMMGGGPGNSGAGRQHFFDNKMRQFGPGNDNRGRFGGGQPIVHPGPGGRPGGGLLFGGGSGHVPQEPLPHFPNQPGQGQHGYQGLEGIFQMLSQGGLNGDQLANLGKGYTGGNGYAVGHAHGAFGGLSPYAAHWLATSGILQQAAPHLQDTTGLTGDALFSANMMNQLAQSQAQNGPYTLHSGITQDMLGQMLGMTQGGGYAKGYNATGRINPINGQNFQ